MPEKISNTIIQIEQDLPKISGFRSGYLLEILSVIAINVKRDENCAALKMAYLRKIIPQADKYIKALIFLGIIERQGNYRVGATSYTYCFNDQYKGKYSVFPVTDPFLIKRLDKHHLKRQNSKKYPGQNSFIRKLTILPESLESVNCNNLESQNYAVGSIVRILNNEIFYSVDSTSGRYHSNLTNLPSFLRPYIRINNVTLANIDIKNCQPYLSTVLLTNPGKAAPYAKDLEFSLMLETLEPIVNKDVQRYISLVNSGKIYEYLLDQFRERKLYPSSRDEIKRQMLIILFARNTMKTEARKIFEHLFPSVARRFEIMRGNLTGSKFQNFKRFAILLQNIESGLVLDNIMGRINQERPETIAVTIHDSIMTSVLTNDIGYVKTIMSQELTRFVGFSPTLKTEKYRNGELREEKERNNTKSNTMLEPLYSADNQNVGIGGSTRSLF